MNGISRDSDIRTGRLVGAAKAAASAASVGYAAAIAQSQPGEDVYQDEVDMEDTEMDIMYDVLMMQFSPQNQDVGLILDVILQWDQVQDILDAGFVDQTTLSDIFCSCADEKSIGFAISKEKFAQFAEKLDVASDMGIYKLRESETVFKDRASVDIGNVVNNFRDPTQNVHEVNNVMVSTTKLELSSPQAHSAKGIADLIRNAPKSKGRLVAAAAAAAAAASLGASKLKNNRNSSSQTSDSKRSNIVDGSQHLPQDEMEVLFSVLLTNGVSGAEGLTLDTICQWNAIQNMLESGIVDEVLIQEVFSLHCETVDGANLKQIITKDKFRMFAENMDAIVSGDHSCLFIKTQDEGRHHQKEKTRTARTSSLFNSLADLEAMSSSFEPPKPPLSYSRTVGDDYTCSHGNASSDIEVSNRSQLSSIKEPDVFVKKESNNKKSGGGVSPARTRTRSPQRSSAITSPARTRSPQRSSAITSPARTRSPQRTKSPSAVRSIDETSRDSALKASLEASKQREKLEFEAKLESDRIARGVAAKERMESRRAQSPVRGGGRQKSPMATRAREKAPTRSGAISPKSATSIQQQLDEAAIVDRQAERDKLDVEREARRLAAQARMEARKAASPFRGRSPQCSPNRNRPKSPKT